MSVIGTVFTRQNQYGDFNWMIKQEEYDDSLFIYSDNIECFLSLSRKAGAGNAIIRPYRFAPDGYPRSSPIVTGSLANGGFSKLNDEAKNLIDQGINEIKDKIRKYKYKRVFYSAESPNGILGQRLFVIDDNVKKYITNQLRLVYG